MVVQYPAAATSVAVYCIDLPCAATRAGNTFNVQLVRNSPWTITLRDHAKDLFDDQRLIRVNLGLTFLAQPSARIDRNAVAKADAASGQTIFDFASLSSMCLSRGLYDLHRNPLETGVAAVLNEKVIYKPSTSKKTEIAILRRSRGVSPLAYSQPQHCRDGELLHFKCA